MPLSFLLVGMAWEEIANMVPADKVDETLAFVRKALDKGEQPFKDAGAEYKLVTYGLGESMDRLEGVLKEKQWSGVCIGAGLRLTREYTPLFEQMINTVHVHAPETKILFNLTPDGTFEAAQRWFPELGAGTGGT